MDRSYQAVQLFLFPFFRGPNTRTPGFPGIPGFPGNPGGPVGPSFPSRPSFPGIKRNLKHNYQFGVKEVLDQVQGQLTKS